MTQWADPSEIGKVKPPLVLDPNNPYLQRMDQRTWTELSDLYDEGRVGDEIDLFSKACKVASSNPKLAKHLDPILKDAAHEIWAEAHAFRMAKAAFPKVIHAKRWARMTNPERHALMKKLANKPILFKEGLTKSKVRAGEAFMLYLLDPGSNTSKFYEGLIIEVLTAFGRMEGYQVIRRWGRMTDSGRTGRIDGAKFDDDSRFYSNTITGAKRILQKVYQAKTRKGYIDAFGPKHRTPDGKKLPMGQYPVGLGAAGFGWGGQSVQKCIPGLRYLEDALTQARLEIQQTGETPAVEDHLDETDKLLRLISHEDSTMAKYLKDKIEHVLRRLRGSPRFLPDPDERKLAKELYTIINYVRKQLSHCQ